jgi:hypothetical protein
MNLLTRKHRLVVVVDQSLKAHSVLGRLDGRRDAGRAVRAWAQKIAEDVEARASAVREATREWCRAETSTTRPTFNADNSRKAALLNWAEWGHDALLRLHWQGKPLPTKTRDRIVAEVLYAAGLFDIAECGDAAQSTIDELLSTDPQRAEVSFHEL